MMIKTETADNEKIEMTNEAKKKKGGGNHENNRYSSK